MVCHQGSGLSESTSGSQCLNVLFTIPNLSGESKAQNPPFVDQSQSPDGAR